MIFASRRAAVTLAAVTLAATMCWTVPASAQQAQPQPLPTPQQQGPATFGPDELVGAGHKFFGNVSRGLASIIERAVSQWGLPNGYVLGQEAGGAVTDSSNSIYHGRNRRTRRKRAMKRWLLAYLLKPVTKTMSEAFTER